ncbi:hypothetical protein [Flavobacterium sandaracinum]|uniref:hypothetical protein n=1 Tax=Flavobacterium sandaracinum TaxID=2541733 RepID=UPI00140475DA|nr:hypothetical protein [Flavobacterium sandaracinum]
MKNTQHLTGIPRNQMVFSSEALGLEDAILPEKLSDTSGINCQKSFWKSKISGGISGKIYS